MRIRKQYQVIPTNAKLENGDSTSETNGYTAEYINDHSVVVSATEPTGNARKKVWLQHSKNILDCRSLETTTISGVTFTPVYDSNGALLYINVNGTATSNCVYHISSQKKFNGSYILSGVSNGSTSSYYIDFGNYVYITNEEATFNMSSSNNYDPIITVINGTTLNNVKFYPMLRVSTNIDNTYEPYVEDKEYILNDNDDYEEYAPQNEIYSTNEVRIGTWMGKPIYRKIFTGSTGSTDYVDLSAPNVDKLIKEGGYIFFSSFQFPVPSTFGTDGANDIRVIKLNTNTLRIQHGSGLQNRNYEIFVEYTKTAD